MSRTRVKICGITTPADAEHAAAAGADAIGLVFYPGSARSIEPEQAAAIVAALPPFVTPVALFLDAAGEQIAAVLERVRVGMLQFHGSEAVSFCRSFGRPYIKTVGMADTTDPATVATAYPDAAGLLTDSHGSGCAGGTGHSFAWDRLPARRDYGLILAGGLTPDNVAAAVTTVRPDAVDVSTGVERAPGRKDAARIQRFIEEVRRGDRNET
mgnify:CR=1 FL=1